MKQRLLLALLLVFTMESFSQDSNLSIEANYPVLIGDNLIGEHYSGIIDVGAKYRFADYSAINIGASFNGGILVHNSNNEFYDLKVTSYAIQPKIFAELDLKSIAKFHPFVGFGYTFLISNASETINGLDVPDSSNTKSGINFNLGIAYDITEKWFAQVQYDFVKFKAEDGPSDPFITNMNILKIGLGFRL